MHDVTSTIEPLVSPAWLEAQLGATEPAASAAGRLVVVDLRESHLYAAVHIPGSISIPFSPMSDWAVSDDELLMELPAADDLFAVLSAWGIGPASTVVLVGPSADPAPAPPYALGDPPRVVATLWYLGVRAVAVLDGGFSRWAAEGRPVTAEVPAALPSPWKGPVAADMFVSTEYMKEHLGKVRLLDGRDADQFFGVTACAFAGVGGHIPTAQSFPVPWIWREDGTYRPVDELRAMAEGILGQDREQEIIVYCGVGGYAGVLWFVLSRILGYRNVRIYDGSAEAWAKGEAMVSHCW
jgi:thiosulfate/3-mercaptopyruvate sulfurtransferase